MLREEEGQYAEGEKVNFGNAMEFIPSLKDDDMELLTNLGVIAALWSATSSGGASVDGSR